MEGMEKLAFELGDSTWHGYPVETVWVRVLVNGLYRLENTPFFACGVSYRDVVEAVRAESGQLTYRRTIRSGGHSTYRVIPGQGLSEADFRAAWRPIEPLGCSFEEARWPFWIYAIDVPSAADIHRVYGLLERGEAADIWGFEEGHCGHDVGGWVGPGPG